MNTSRLLVLAAALVSTSAFAALPNGARAPDFTTQASLAGKPFSFSLADALKQGPVVLYFYPAAFTKGCTLEAHDFALPVAAGLLQHAADMRANSRHRDAAIRGDRLDGLACRELTRNARLGGRQVEQRLHEFDRWRFGRCYRRQREHAGGAHKNVARRQAYGYDVSDHDMFCVYVVDGERPDARRSLRAGDCDGFAQQRVRVITARA